MLSRNHGLVAFTRRVCVTCSTVWKTANKWGTTESPTELANPWFSYFREGWRAALLIARPVHRVWALQLHPGCMGEDESTLSPTYVRVRCKGLWAECYRTSNILHLLYPNLKILEAVELFLQGGSASIGLNNWGAPSHLAFPSTFFFFFRKWKCVTASQFICLLFYNLKWSEVGAWQAEICFNFAFKSKKQNFFRLNALPSEFSLCKPCLLSTMTLIGLG